MNADRDAVRTPSSTRKLVWTMLALAFATAAASGRIDTLGQTYAQDALTRALVTFAVARALNGVISTAQGTEVSLEPGGVGVNFSVGEMLDPINDLVERFSAVMLVATSSIGLQSILLRMTAWWGVSAVLIGLAALTLASLWIPAAKRLSAAGLTRWLVIVALVRFAVPALLITSSIVFDAFLADEHAEATQALETARDEIEDFNEQADVTEDDEASLFDQLGNLVSSLDARERVESLRNRVAGAAENIVDLIVIFVFQTIVLPLLFLWFVAELVKAVIARTTVSTAGASG